LRVLRRSRGPSHKTLLHICFFFVHDASVWAVAGPFRGLMPGVPHTLGFARDRLFSPALGGAKLSVLVLRWEQVARQHPFHLCDDAVAVLTRGLFVGVDDELGAPGLAGFETRASATHHIGKLVGLLPPVRVPLLNANPFGAAQGFGIGLPLRSRPISASTSTSSGQAKGRGRFGPAHRTSPTHDLWHEHNLHPVQVPSAVSPGSVFPTFSASDLFFESMIRGMVRNVFDLR